MYHFQNISDQEHTQRQSRFDKIWGKLWVLRKYFLVRLGLRSSSSTTKELHEAATQAKSYQELCEQSQHLKQVKSL